MRLSKLATIWLMGMTMMTLTPMLVQGKFYYKNFNERYKLSINGDAVRAGECISLTDPARTGQQVGSLWYLSKLPAKDGFQTFFTVKFASHAAKSAVMHRTPAGPEIRGCEGLAFVVQTSGSNVLGLGGSGIGYAGLLDGIAVEFDTRHSGEEKDPLTNHISIHSAVRSPLSQYEVSRRAWLNTSDILVVRVCVACYRIPSTPLI